MVLPGIQVGGYADPMVQKNVVRDGLKGGLITPTSRAGWTYRRYASALGLLLCLVLPSTEREYDATRDRGA